MSTPEFPEERNTPPSEDAGFFAALFDFEFKSFVALRFIKVIYIIAIVFIGLAGLGFLFFALAQGDVLSVLFALVGLFFYLILVRVTLEVIALLFRIGEDTTAIRKALAER
jgi:hypothetical protein